MKTPVDLVKNVRRRSTPAVIYWEVEKERRLISLSSSLSRAARVFIRLTRNLLRLSPFLLTLNVKTRHPTGDTSVLEILFEVARIGKGHPGVKLGDTE